MTGKVWSWGVEMACDSGPAWGMGSVEVKVGLWVSDWERVLAVAMGPE